MEKKDLNLKTKKRNYKKHLGKMVCLFSSLFVLSSSLFLTSCNEKTPALPTVVDPSEVDPTTSVIPIIIPTSPLFPDDPTIVPTDPEDPTIVNPTKPVNPTHVDPINLPPVITGVIFEPNVIYIDDTVTFHVVCTDDFTPVDKLVCKYAVTSLNNVDVPITGNTFHVKEIGMHTMKIRIYDGMGYKTDGIINFEVHDISYGWNELVNSALETMFTKPIPYPRFFTNLDYNFTQGRFLNQLPFIRISFPDVPESELKFYESTLEGAGYEHSIEWNFFYGELYKIVINEDSQTSISIELEYDEGRLSIYSYLYTPAKQDEVLAVWDKNTILNYLYNRTSIDNLGDYPVNSKTSFRYFDNQDANPYGSCKITVSSTNTDEVKIYCDSLISAGLSRGSYDKFVSINETSFYTKNLDFQVKIIGALDKDIVYIEMHIR